MSRIVLPFSPLSPVLNPPIVNGDNTYEVMPYILVDYDEDTDTEYWDERLCREHGRFIPCRPCMYRDSGNGMYK